MGEVNERQGKHVLIVHGCRIYKHVPDHQVEVRVPRKQFSSFIIFFNMPSIYCIINISIAVTVTPSENPPHSPAGTQEDPIFMTPLENSPPYHSGTREDPRSGTEQNPIYIRDEPNSGE